MTTHVNGTNANGESSGISPKITLYTSHACPWAHRAAITLKCLNLPYEEVLIDLTKPRSKEYLEINPRGLVPSIKISNGILEDEIITESAIVSTFLADSFPNSDFYPKSHESPTSALTRARISFFVDTWFTRANTLQYAIMKASDGEEKEKLGRDLVAAMEKEIEPLLKDAAPFFGGSKVMTLAEALTAPFAIRYQAFSEAGLMPASMGKALKELPNYGKWSEAVCAQESVTYVFDGPGIAEGMKKRIEKLRAEEGKT